MNKLYKDKFGAMFIIGVDGNVRMKSIDGPGWITFPPKARLGFMLSMERGEVKLIANNYQEKPRCSQQDSRSSSCHASEATAKSSGLLSRLFSVFSGNAKK
mgnify:CR=1 FL=1